MPAHSAPGADQTPPAPHTRPSRGHRGASPGFSLTWAVGAGLVSLGGYITLGLAGNLREHLGLYLGLHAGLFGVYAATALKLARGSPRHSGTARAVVLLFALAFRASLAFVPASLSDDLHRYVWDGRVQAAGINPYRYAPADDRLRFLRDEGWKAINHREIQTIYPPASEWIFLAAAAAGRPA